MRIPPIVSRIADGPYWGPMTWQRHRALCERGIHLHVYSLEGEDLTTRTRFFDDTPGHVRAVLYALGPNGRFVHDPELGTLLEVRGAFLVREGEPFDQARGPA